MTKKTDAFLEGMILWRKLYEESYKVAKQLNKPHAFDVFKNLGPLVTDWDKFNSAVASEAKHPNIEYEEVE